MDRQRRPGVAGGDRGGGHRSGRVVPRRAVAAPRSRPPGRRPVPCRAGRQPLRRPGPPPGAERDAGPSWPQGRSAVSDPQAVAHRLRTPRRTRLATGCCSACASATPTTSCSAPGWPRSRCATSTSPTTPADAATLLDKAIVGCTADEVAEIRSLGKTLAVVAHRDPRPPRHRRLQRPDRGTQPVREEGEAMRPRLPILRATTGYASCSTPAASPGPTGPRPPRIRTRSPHSDA